MRALSLIFAALAVTNALPSRVETKTSTTNAVSVQLSAKPLAAKTLSVGATESRRIPGLIITGKRARQ